MQAIIYARFSNLEQIGGHSTKRQVEMAADFCAQRGWEVAPERVHVEKGKSAFSGANREKGSFLHTFEQEVAIGIHRGRVFVVEALDRISRQGYESVLNFINDCLKAGVTVATVANARIYPAYGRVEMVEVIELVVASDLANRESAQKSRRVRAAYDNKRKAAEAGDAKAIMSRPPSWIGIDPVTRVPFVIEERADVVREAYRLAEAGMGTPMIAKTLNERNVPTWRAKSQGGGWHESYVYRMLSTRTVLGEFVSTTYKTRILDHYPAIITADQYARVAAIRERRRVKRNGRYTEKMSNLLSGLCRCDECGRNMTMRTPRIAGSTTLNRSGNKTVTQATYLVCETAKRKVTNEAGDRVCHNNRTVRYERIEPVILDQLLRLAFDGDTLNQRETSDARVALAEIDRQIEFHEEQASKLGENLKDQISPTLMRMLTDVEAKVLALRQDRTRMQEHLDSQHGAAASPAMLERIRQTRSRLDSADLTERREARVMVADALKTVVSMVVCDSDGAATVIIGGGMAAFKIDKTGTITDRYDASGDEAVVRAMTSGERAKMAPAVHQLIRRAKASHAS